jgi:hypothetical protein
MMADVAVDAELLAELLAELEDLRAARSLNAARVAEAESRANWLAQRADEAEAERDAAVERADEAGAEAEAERDEVCARRIGYVVLREYGVDLGPWACLPTEHERRIDTAAGLVLD